MQTERVGKRSSYGSPTYPAPTHPKTYLCDLCGLEKHYLNRRLLRLAGRGRVTACIQCARGPGCA